MDANIVRDIESSFQEVLDEDKNISGVLEENIVDFDGPNDPEDPLNWSPIYKWSMVALISVLSLVV